ncbi:MAG TPA: ATP-binding protein [Acidimicrobiales bacterium]|nr:ATP-binding protein [Acidimicrobiales bacterium]
MPVSALRRPIELSPQPAVARRELARLLDDAHWSGDSDGALLAVHEAMVNSHRHGGGVTRATAGFDGRSLVVRVCDRGRGFEVPKSPQLADNAAERGRGLFLIRHLASDAHVVRAGRDVQLVLTFAP